MLIKIVFDDKPQNQAELKLYVSLPKKTKRKIIKVLSFIAGVVSLSFYLFKAMN